MKGVLCAGKMPGRAWCFSTQLGRVVTSDGRRRSLIGPGTSFRGGGNRGQKPVRLFVVVGYLGISGFNFVFSLQQTGWAI
jgi:hypothetical protein